MHRRCPPESHSHAGHGICGQPGAGQRHGVPGTCYGRSGINTDGSAPGQAHAHITSAPGKSGNRGLR